MFLKCTTKFQISTMILPLVHCTRAIIINAGKLVMMYAFVFQVLAINYEFRASWERMPFSRLTTQEFHMIKCLV